MAFLVTTILVLGTLVAFCANAAFLWLSSRWMQIPDVSYRRAMLAMLPITLVSWVTVGIQFAIRESHPGVQLTVALTSVLLMFVVLKWLLRGTVAKTLATGLIGLVMSFVFGVVVVVLLRVAFRRTAGNNLPVAEVARLRA